MNILPQRLLAGSIMVAAVFLSAASIVLLAAFPLGCFVRFGWPLWPALFWDAGLSFLFFLQHSGMVRPRFRAVLHVPQHYQGAIYAIASGVALLAVVLLWQPTDVALLVLEGAPRWAAHVCAILALAFFVWGIVALRDFDPCGVAPIRAHLRGVRSRQLPLVIRGPYRWVRHPLYSAILVLFWSNPDVTADRLLFNILWTAWICLGVYLEEADLRDDFGETYAQYQRKVPALIPWRGPVKL
jgi:protein-S-isoprenylcysteine O-methyltransferase Ste14